MRRLCAVMIAAVALAAAGWVTPAAAGDGERGDWLPATPAGWPMVVNQARSAPQAVTSGVALATDSLETVGGPERASLLDVDLANPNVRLGVVAAHDRLFSPDETLSSMAVRTHAVAGINGDYFEVGGPGRPINMVAIDGRLVQSPGEYAVLGVTRDGRLTMAHETFSGTVTAGAATHSLDSVNILNYLGDNGLVLVTPDEGTDVWVSGGAVAVLARGQDGGYSVVQVSTDVGVLPALQGQDALVGRGTSAAWLASSVHAGDRLTITHRVSPDDGLQQAIGGGPIVVRDGAYFEDPDAPAPSETNVQNPVTGVGVSRDGRHAFMAVFDGRNADLSLGLTRPQMASYLIRHGADRAILLDSGGSSELVARQPGQTAASVVNSPSDGRERPIADGLFVYSTEAAPAPATSVMVNTGRPLTVLAGTSVPAGAYALDAAGNPAVDPVQLAVVPPGLAQISGASVVTGDRTGEGLLVATAGDARSTVRLTVTDHLASLAIAPSAPDIDSGRTRQFSLSGSTRDGQPVLVPATAAAWRVSPSELGTIDAGGLFTASPDAAIAGMATVTATVDGRTATASVAVGRVGRLIDDMTHVQDWAVTPRGGATGSISLSTTVKRLPTDAGSMDVRYGVPAGSGVKQIVFYPNKDELFPPPDSGQNPSAVALWVKGDSSGLLFAEAFMQVNNQLITLYPTTITFNDWRLVVANLPAGLQFPLNVWFLDFLVINPSQSLAGDLYLSDLQALYSPRPAAVVPYVAIPDNPSWLQFVQSPARFDESGSTTASFGDAGLVAAAPGSTGAVVLGAMAEQMGALPEGARPSAIQTQGSIAGSGELPDLQFAKASLDAFGIPYHSAVGTGETSGGAHPENGNYASVFGPTHSTYMNGPARFIVLDTSHRGVLASNPYQVPAEEQYGWLADQLTTNTSPVVFVTASVPAYDPHPGGGVQLSNAWEASMYEAIAARYMLTHPGNHVVLLSGAARGFAESVRDGVPSFVVADAGLPAFAPAGQGGFPHYVLFHVQPSGRVEFAVMPVLTAISVTAPTTTLVRGDRTLLSAVGTAPGGSDRPALQVPIGDPASHVWTSSDPGIAAVDPVTGEVTARAPGTVTIRCEVGAIAGQLTLTVQ